MKHSLAFQKIAKAEAKGTVRVPVQERLNISMEEAIRRIVTNPTQMEALKSRQTRATKLMSEEQFKDGVCYKMPQYMSELEQEKMVSNLMKNIDKKEALEKEIKEVRAKEAKRLEKEAVMNKLREEVRAELTKPEPIQGSTSPNKSS